MVLLESDQEGTDAIACRNTSLIDDSVAMHPFLAFEKLETAKLILGVLGQRVLHLFQRDQNSTMSP
jgi:hypothetical protein